MRTTTVGNDVHVFVPKHEVMRLRENGGKGLPKSDVQITFTKNGSFSDIRPRGIHGHAVDRMVNRARRFAFGEEGR